MAYFGANAPDRRREAYDGKKANTNTFSVRKQELRISKNRKVIKTKRQTRT